MLASVSRRLSSSSSSSAAAAAGSRGGASLRLASRVDHGSRHRLHAGAAAATSAARIHTGGRVHGPRNLLAPLSGSGGFVGSPSILGARGLATGGSGEASPVPIPLETLLAGVAPEPGPGQGVDCLGEIRRRLAAGKGRQKLVVVDDDPTGTQSVKGFPVLSEWTPQALARELADESTVGFFLLSNIRAMPPDEAARVCQEIRSGLDEALKMVGRGPDSVTVISRSDSTLRGHFPLDVDILVGGQGDATRRLVIVAPYFEAGGRLTINDVHYMTTASSSSSSAVSVLPVHLTPFAKDRAFGFRASNLKDWVAEKLGGAVKPEEVASITLDDIRRRGPEGVKQKLLSLLNDGAAASGTTTRYVAVNAVTRGDLEVAVCGSLLAEEAAAGKKHGHFVYRTAADWVAIRGGLEPLAPLPADFFKHDDEEKQEGKHSSSKAGVGGLVVVGSYVPKSSEQLQLLREGRGARLEAVEVQVDEVIRGEPQRQEEARRVTQAVESLVKEGKDVVVYTTRKLRQDDGAGGLVTGQAVSDTLVDVVRNLTVRPHFLIAKGGITSNDIAVKGLSIKRAMTCGPILPGVPVWECGQESKFPRMKYVVFPGNVGSPRALLDAVDKLSRHQQQQSPSSASKQQQVHVRTQGPQSRTLDILAEAHARQQAVGAFNVYNLEGVRAVAMAAQATGSSAILQIHPSSLEYGGAPLIELCKAAQLYLQQQGGAGGGSQPRIAVHLDHAHQEEAIMMALALGVDSVMCDGSALPYEDNVAWTRKMTERAHAKGVPVEAELGRLAGEEDGLSVAEKEAKMTDPAQVPDFIGRTGVDMIAVTIGNVHGKYAVDPPVLDLPRLERIRAATDRPLVLHGASGLPAELVHAVIRRGVCKFNVNTEVREACMRVLREGKAKDVLPLMQATGAAMQAVIEGKMRLFRP